MAKVNQQRRITRIATPWLKDLGLNDWEITIEIAPDKVMNNNGWAPGFETYAECSAHWEYQRAIIRFSEEQLEKSSDGELGETIVHELLHCVLNELRREHKMVSEERTATVLTRALLKVAA